MKSCRLRFSRNGGSIPRFDRPSFLVEGLGP
jgi:hypothetical protein